MTDPDQSYPNYSPGGYTVYPFRQFVAEYADALASPQFNESDLRKGQLWFNMLTGYNSPLADRLRACPLDPFHWDEVSSEVWAFAEENW